MNVTDGIINLVKIFFVVIRPGHAAQLLDHLLRLLAAHHFGHGNTCVELEFVWRMHPYDAFKGLVCVFVVT